MSLSFFLHQKLKSIENQEYKPKMEAYMKNNFVFFGINSPLRKTILKNFIAENKVEIYQNFRQISEELYQYPERECHYCAIEIMNYVFKKDFQESDIFLIKKLITTHSWWDSVDSIAPHLLGSYLKKFPEKKLKILENFSNSDNMWLNRSAIIFQLLYKKDVEEDILFAMCEKFSYSKEFFIQKAIGWALRNYAKINPIAVKNFVAIQNLKPLSVREALKHQNK
jgi:3-methyladenine DNA glycosylase AlkD